MAMVNGTFVDCDEVALLALVASCVLVNVVTKRQNLRKRNVPAHDMSRSVSVVERGSVCDDPTCTNHQHPLCSISSLQFEFRDRN